MGYGIWDMGYGIPHHAIEPLYHRVKGEGTRQRLSGRERGYHGLGFGGISVVGIDTNRKFFWQFARGSRSFASHSQSRTQCFQPQTTGMGSAFGG